MFGVVPEPQPLLTYAEVAKRLGVSEITVRRLVEKHELPAVRLLGAVRFRPEDVDALIAADDPKEMA